MPSHYGSYDHRAHVPLLAKSLARAQMQNRRPLQMGPGVPYDPEMMGGYSGQIEGHSAPAQVASLIGNLAKSITPQILARREAQRKAQAGKDWSNILIDAAQTPDQTITRPKTQLGGERGEPIVTETIPGKPRSGREQRHHAAMAAMAHESPEVQEHGRNLYLDLVKEDPPAPDWIDLHPPKGSGLQTRTMDKSDPVIQQFFNAGWTTEKPDVAQNMITGVQLKELYDGSGGRYGANVGEDFLGDLFSITADGTTVKHVQAGKTSDLKTYQLKIKDLMEANSALTHTDATNIVLGIYDKIIDPTTNSVIGYFDMVNKKPVYFRDLATGVETSEEPPPDQQALNEALRAVTGGQRESIEDAISYAASNDKSILSWAQYYSFGGATREVIGGLPVGAEAADKLWKTMVEKAVDWAGWDMPEGFDGSLEDVKGVRTKYKSLQEKLIKGLKQSSKAAMQEQTRILAMLPSLTSYERPENAIAALNSIGADMVSVIEAFENEARDPNTDTKLRETFAMQSQNLRTALASMGYNPELPSLVSPEGIAKLSLENINNVPTDIIALIQQDTRLVGNTGKTLLQLIVERKNYLELAVE